MAHFILILALTFGFSSPDGGERYLPWSPDQKLTWEDFQGPADHSTSMKAHTISKLRFSWKCAEGDLSFTVGASFDRGKSWKKDLMTDRLLAHEQLHFDITELFARKLRQVLTELEEPCAPDTDIKAAAEQVHREWQKMQDVYDLESDHSRDAEMQAHWEEKVANELEALAEFASK